MSNLVITSTTAGVVPTLSNLAEGQLGVNTADGKMFVNTGTEIKSIGGSVWKPESYPENIIVSTVSPTYETVLVLEGPVLIMHGQINLSTFGTKRAKARITINGEVFPDFDMDNTNDQYGNLYDMIAICGKKVDSSNLRVQTALTSISPPILCDTFKLELLSELGNDIYCDVGFCYGNME